MPQSLTKGESPVVLLPSSPQLLSNPHSTNSPMNLFKACVKWWNEIFVKYLLAYSRCYTNAYPFPPQRLNFNDLQQKIEVLNIWVLPPDFHPFPQPYCKLLSSTYTVINSLDYLLFPELKVAFPNSMPLPMTGMDSLLSLLSQEVLVSFKAQLGYYFLHETFSTCPHF